MTRRILVGYLVLTVFILAMLTVPLGLAFAARERDTLFTAIERDARVVAAESDDAFEEQAYAPLPALAADFAHKMEEGRVVLVDATGRSIVDSADLDGPKRNFSTRPEVAAALAGKFAKGARESSTLGTSIAYVAVPVRHDDRVMGAVRVSYPSTTVDRRTRGVWILLIALDAAALVVVAAVGWFVAGSLAKPVLALEDAADSLAAGDLTARVAVGGPDDLVQVGQTFNTMAARLESLIESQRAFLADASHQLRTPLTALRLRIESLADAQEGADGAAASDVEAARTEVDRLSELVDALLAMARLDARAGDVVVVDAATIVAERVATWAPLAEERGLALVVGSADRVGAASARAVDGGLEQVLDNLIANAVDYAPTDSEIVVSAEVERSSVVVSVADRGPGLPPAQAERAFDRFWRAPDAVPGGSGLGLAIVRRLAEASGGTARATPRDGGGLVVEVRLPLSSAN